MEYFSLKGKKGNRERGGETRETEKQETLRKKSQYLQQACFQVCN